MSQANTQDADAACRRVAGVIRELSTFTTPAQRGVQRIREFVRELIGEKESLSAAALVGHAVVTRQLNRIVGVDPENDKLRETLQQHMLAWGSPGVKHWLADPANREELSALLSQHWTVPENPVTTSGNPGHGPKPIDPRVMDWLLGNPQEVGCVWELWELLTGQRPPLKPSFKEPQPTPTGPDPYDVAPGDDLYWIYRHGLITRHLCANGRVDEETWLQETKPDMSGVRTMRWRIERFRDGTNPAIKERAFAWVPLTREHDGRILNFGGGENPLLNAGLALATLSFEGVLARHSGEFRQSFEPAQLIAQFILNSQRGRGWFLRQDSAKPYDKPKAASTDELLGVLVGFLFFRKFAHRAAACLDNNLRRRAENLAKSVDGTLADVKSTYVAHGGWYLPLADDWGERFQFEMGRQTAWIFCHPLALFFGLDAFTGAWETGEYKRYFPEYLIDAGNILTAKEMHQADSVCEVLECFFLLDTKFDLLGGQVKAGTGRSLLVLMCEAIKYIFEKSNYPTQGDFVDSLLTTLKKLCPIPLQVSDRIVRSSLQKLYDWAVYEGTANFYNFHLFALAAILAIESGADARLRELLGATFLSMLNGREGFSPGRRNALFAAVATLADPRNASHPMVLEALAFLTSGCKAGEYDSGFQHDQPLKVIPWLRSPHFQSRWPHLPYDWNPDLRWGTCRVYSNTDALRDRVISDSASDRVQMELSGVLSKSGGSVITCESCEVDFLFTRMLAAYVREKHLIPYEMWPRLCLPEWRYTRSTPLKVLGAEPVP